MTSEATEGQIPDVYGQVHPVETSELIQQKLQDFQTELTKLIQDKNVDTKWLETAQVKCPKLCNSQDFQLLFLRCEVYNVDLATIRYVNYWTKRVEIFGPERAFLPLNLYHLLEQDKKEQQPQGNDSQNKPQPTTETAFHLGVMTLMENVKDPSGRAIIVYDPSKLDKSQYTTQTLLQTFWYIFHAALEEETVQKHGVVVIGDPQHAKLSQFDRSIAKALIGSLKGALPVRLSGFHMIHPPAFVAIIFPIIKVFMPERMRKRVRFHSGTNEKVLNELETKFGLTKDMLPTTIGGTVHIHHKEWLKKRSTSSM